MTDLSTSLSQLPPSSLTENDEETSSEERLSADLALFLSNPSLKAALADGSLDLASYSTTVQEELHDLESQCINAYRLKQKEISSLKTDLEECDAVLGALQEMLLGFQADLGGLSGDIRNLQEKSQTLGVQLRNRRKAEEGLRLYLEKVVIAPNLTNAVCRGPVNTTFLESVHQLQTIHYQVHSNEPQPWSSNEAPSQTKAGNEMQDHVHKLRLVAVSRTRDYFLSQMVLLKRPKTNVRMVQVHGLVKYADLQDFLQDACPEIAKEIFNVYVEVMGKTLYALFRTYQAQLHQLDITKSSTSRQDVIAIEDAALRDALTTKAKKRVDSFALGSRLDNVLEEGMEPIMAHVAMAEGKRYPYEMLFRSIMMHLMNAVTNEHVFCRQFFKRDAFQSLFNHTLGYLLEQLENYLFSCHDGLALLLMLKVTHANRRIMKNRKVNSMDPFFESVTRLLWPRLKTVMDSHLRSIKSATAPKLGGVDLHAHYVSRRYAEFTASILLILQKNNNVDLQPKQPSLSRSNSGGSLGAATTPPALSANISSGSLHRGSAGDMLMSDLQQILNETVALLERLSEQHTSNKKRTVFLINNYDQIICIFQERRLVGKELNRFLELLMTQREVFVEEELLETFSKMIAFVQQTEAELALSNSKKEVVNAAVVESLVREFSSNWKQGIEQINRNVLRLFSNFRNGMEILKQVLTQLLLYYTRFQDVIRKVWRGKPPAFCKDLVSTTVILAEIKKYALAI